MFQLLILGENEEVLLRKIVENFQTVEETFAELSSLNLADPLNGTEVFYLLQNGVGVKGTTQQILDNPAALQLGMNLSNTQNFSNFSKTSTGFITTTNDTLFGAEPFVCLVGNTGSVRQASGVILITTGAMLQTNSSSTGYAGVVSTQTPMLFDPTKAWDVQFTVSAANLSTAPQAYTHRNGLINYSSYPKTIPEGMYFEYDHNSGNIFAVVRAASVSSRYDTGVTVATSTLYVCRVFYDPTIPGTKFYINGNLVQTILNSERVVTTFTPLGMHSALNKTNGTTSAGVYTLMYKHRNTIGQVLHY